MGRRGGGRDVSLSQDNLKHSLRNKEGHDKDFTLSVHPWHIETDSVPLLLLHSTAHVTFMRLVIHMSVCLSVRLYVCLSVCLSVCLFVCLSVCLYVCLSVCLFVCLTSSFDRSPLRCWSLKSLYHDRNICRGQEGERGTKRGRFGKGLHSTL